MTFSHDDTSAALHEANPTVTSLRTEAWRHIVTDPQRQKATAETLIDLARRCGDAEGEAYGLFHLAYVAVRREPVDDAQRLAEQARERCAALGVESARLLCEVVLGFVAVRRGACDDAIAIGEHHEHLPVLRPPAERCVTLMLLYTACYLEGRVESALHHCYRHLELARAFGDDAQQAQAQHNLGAVHTSVFNVEDARPLLEHSFATWHRLNAPWARLALTAAHLIYVYDAQGLHQQAFEVADELLSHADGVDADSLHMNNARFALALLGVGRVAQAEELLAMGPQEPRLNPRLEVNWCWVQGLWLCRQGRHEEARQLCRRYLEVDAGRVHFDMRQDLVHLHEVISTTSEALGDSASAWKALRAAQAAAVPLVGLSARAHLIALQVARGFDDEPAEIDNAHQQRLDAIDRGVGEYRAKLAAAETPPLAPVAPPAPKPHRFLAHVSQEMRAPLDGMLGMTSLLLVSQLDDRQRRFVAAAKTSAETMLRLVNDILDLAKIEAGRYRLDPQPFIVEQLLSEVIDLFTVQVEQKGIALELRFGPNVPASMTADPLRMRQVLTNLVSNAVKFTAAGGVTVHAAVAEADATRLRFEVRDSGKGISDEAQAQLFTEFMQEDATIATRFGGTGLGLALSRRLVRLMGGEIGATSKLGVGSTFWFELPR